MERRFFGTDGLRGVANTPPLTADICLALGRAVGHVCRRQGDPSTPPTVVIGWDTRASCDMIVCALSAGLAGAGVTVQHLGVVPTPAVAFNTAHSQSGAGLMVSASHNPYQDNGVKVFGGDGFKLSDEQELALESLMMDPTEIVPAAADHVGRVVSFGAGRELYARQLRTMLEGQQPLGGVTIALDAANGAAFEVAPAIFTDLGATVIEIGTTPNGSNINLGVGALHPENLAAVVLEAKADLGVALDGDADRLILVDETGQVLDGDLLMAALAVSLKARGKLTQNVLVSTVMSNIGLEIAMREHDIELVRADVGDRYVVNEMRRRGGVFGGEQSGHIIYLDRGTTGDGIGAALLTLDELRRRGAKLSELRGVMTTFPQRLVNINVSAKPPLQSLPSVQRAIAEAERELGASGRVLVRYSGTEKKARVMVEAESEAQIARWIEHIVEAVEAEIGIG